MRLSRRLIFIVFAAALTLSAIAPTFAQDDATDPFLDALRGGGFVFYWRHTLTDRTQEDTDMSSCETQRNLNAQGIADATAIGEAFAALGIPVGGVFSTGFCRTQDTATLGFGRFESADDLLEADGVRERLSVIPEAGMNSVLVGHGEPLLNATNVLIDEGDIMIVQPEGDGRFIVLATIQPSGWAELVAAYAQTESGPVLDVFPVAAGSGPHDVAPDPDGGPVWYVGQRNGTLGRLDAETGEVTEVSLGAGSRPHGVIVGPDSAPWITDGGLNAIVRVDPETLEVEVWPLPSNAANANLNTAAFDGNGVLWFTGQSGFYGSFDPETEEMNVYPSPRGRGPYGIDATPDGEIYFVSLAGSYLADVDEETGEVTVIDPPTPNAGTRRVWSDSQGVLWISEYNAGLLGRYDPADGSWQEWPLPAGDVAAPYAVVVDDRDGVWLSDTNSNTVVYFDSDTETFESFELTARNASIRQMLIRDGEVWAAQSGDDSLLRITLEEMEDAAETDE